VHHLSGVLQLDMIQGVQTLGSAVLLSSMDHEILENKDKIMMR